MKTRSLYRKSLPAVLVVLALALTGCSSSDSEAKNAESEESPLQKYLSALWDEDEYSEEAAAKREAEGEELVAVCMAKEGFEYKPNVRSDVMETISAGEDNPFSGRGTLKYAETYGFGTIDWPGKDEQDEAARQGEAKVMVDPNQDYVESLSEPERRAYNKTLVGDESGIGGGYNGDDPTEYDWTKAGCVGAAEHELQDPGLGAYDDPEFKDLFAKIDEMHMRTASDGATRVANEEQAKLDRKWVDCMADAGYVYTNVYDPSVEFSDEWMKLINGSTTDENGEFREPSAADFRKRDKEEKKLQEREIKVAVVDAKCREKIDYANEEKRITREFEQKFVDENKAQLEAMLVTYGTKRKKSK